MKITFPAFLLGLVPVANAFVVPQQRRSVQKANFDAAVVDTTFLNRPAALSVTKLSAVVAPIDTKEFVQAKQVFPDAMTNDELIEFMTTTLRANGYDERKTLIATSLCCDEVNRPLENALSNTFDTNFNMGGLAGFPFGGATSFGAMASHIPDGGSCAVIYGPHVGIDSKGNVGTVERRGRKSGGACCGSAVAASGYVAGVLGGEEKASLPTSPLDAQQYFVGSMLMPFAERLESAEDRMKELPYALYDAQSDLMKRILAQSGSSVAGDGTTAVLGGIQINTPPGFTDYFLPLSFDLYNSDGKMVKKLLKTDVKPFPKVQDTFPGALTNDELVDKITAALKAKGYDETKTLVATSLCCDEVNRPLETELSEAFDTNFNMGGLAGFPFGGATSFGAMASHIPDGGDCVVVYGPHVGVSATGAVGTTERRGRVNGGACCGSAVAASGYVGGVFSGNDKEAEFPDDPLDAQQYFVGSMLMPYAERLERADDKMVELPYALYDAQSDLMQKIISKSAGAVGGDGKIAVLGGVQINTPPGYTDYYLPISFDLYDNKGALVDKIDL